jgi:transposase
LWQARIKKKREDCEEIPILSLTKPTAEMEQAIRTNVGLDMAKATFWASICALTLRGEVQCRGCREFSNSKKGFKELERWIEEQDANRAELHFTMEATGVYHENLAHYLYGRQHHIHIVLPNKAKKFAESLDSRSKTDKLDAKALGQLGAERTLVRWSPTSPTFKVLKSLTRERASLIAIRTQLKNSLHALRHSHEPNSGTLKRTESIVRELNANVKSIEREIASIVKGDEALRDQLAHLTSIPGVSLLTAVVVAAETDGFSLIGNVRQLCSYAGLDVKVVESGRWKGRSRISKKGNSHIRAALYMPSLSTVRHCNQHKAFYSRIVERKKKSMVGVTAVSRKLLILMYALWKSKAPYQEDYQLKRAS